MITCVSERSGTASSDVRNSAATPKPTAIRTAITVNARWRAHAAIRRSIMAGSPLLRRHQEIAGRHHHLAGAQSREDFVVAARPRAELDLARREAAVAEINEHDMALAGRQD